MKRKEGDLLIGLQRSAIGTLVERMQPLPAPLTDPDQIVRLGIRKRDRLGGALHEYEHAA